MASPQETLKALSEVFNDFLPTPTKVQSLEEVKQFLMVHITRLLEQNPGKLMSIFYRIDVLEHHVKNAFDHAPAGQLPDTLADLIIERQLQKLHYRKDPENQNTK